MRPGSSAQAQSTVRRNETSASSSEIEVSHEASRHSSESAEGSAAMMLSHSPGQSVSPEPSQPQPRAGGASKWKTSGWVPVLSAHDPTLAPSGPLWPPPSLIAVCKLLAPVAVQAPISLNPKGSHVEESPVIRQLAGGTSSLRVESPSLISLAPAPVPQQTIASTPRLVTSPAPRPTLSDEPSLAREARYSRPPRVISARARTPPHDRHAPRYGHRPPYHHLDRYHGRDSYRFRTPGISPGRREGPHHHPTPDHNRNDYDSYRHRRASPSPLRYYRDCRDPHAPYGRPYYDRQSPTPSKDAYHRR
jgi:hypothetical protein